ncbi:hypothetical protein M422DRAFT_263388 [Sphaerobolus stellatus SS14]|uniref:Zn(2)-C6 fungal-type domain-containing protein n=1 Tax=Sphaerobolus stellatus (strain SS14) TaxID=990650 RepID=A0A0C9VAZ4_SPHS4|nr:hypothetical protein M422DRAFT_263388 [Sphaerobolus stellatus SS14]
MAGNTGFMDSPASTLSTKRPRPDQEHTSNPRTKRIHPNTSKACNACRKQKSRCEQLPGDGDGCHRCVILAIPCIFKPEVPPIQTKERKQRVLLPRVQTQKSNEKAGDGKDGRLSSPDNSRLQVLANTTELLSSASEQPPPPVSSSRPKTPLLLQMLSTVESTLLPPPHIDTHTLRFRTDWQRWVAPLTLLRDLLRRNTAPEPHWRQDARPVEADLLSPLEVRQLRQHFFTQYAPWLPTISLFATSTTIPATISPFLSTVIHATAARTLPTPLPFSTISSLRASSLHHVGHIFANPMSYPVIETLYALLALIMWPLEPADDVTSLIHGAKRMAQSADNGRLGLSAHGVYSIVPSIPPSAANLSPEDLDLIRLWYALCTNETIFTLGAGTIATPPPTILLITALGSPSNIALSNRPIADILLTFQASLHRVIVGAMGERTLQPNGSIADGTGRDGSIQSSQAIAKTPEAMLEYSRKVFTFLSKLEEWDIEFKSVKAESPRASHIHFATLEIEYHYLTLIYVTHSLITMCYAIPLKHTFVEAKCSIWSWSVTANKAAHRILELWNKFSSAMSEPGPNHNINNSTTNGAAANQNSPPCTSSRTSPSLSPRHPSSQTLQSQSTGTSLLSLAPNRIYAMVVVAVMLILRHQVAAYEFGRRRSILEIPPAGFTKQAEMAIRRVVRSMGSYSVARSPTSNSSSDQREGIGDIDGGRRTGHAAVRYAEIIDALLRIWEEKHAAKVYAFSSSSGTGACDEPDILSCPCSGSAETSAMTTATRFNSPYSLDSTLPSCDSEHTHAHVPFHHASHSHSHTSHPPHNSLPFQPPQPHYPPPKSCSDSQHIPQPQSYSHLQPAQHPHPHYAPYQSPLEIDLSLLGTDLFSDAAAAFAWDGLGSLDWSLGFEPGSDGGGYNGTGMGMV